MFRKRFISFLLILAITIGAVGATSKQAEAGIASWLAKKVIKKVVVNKAKDVYSSKQLNFKVKATPRKIYVKETVKLKPLICFGNHISWKSSNKKIATVSDKGVVKGKKPGVVMITAKPDISQKVSKIKVTVKARPTIKMTKKMQEGGVKSIYIEGTIEKAKSDNPACVKVEYDKDLGWVDLIGKSAGTCKVTITKKNTQKILITVKVKERKVTSTPKPETPEPDETPVYTETPDYEETPEETPEPTEVPESTVEPDVTEAPEETESSVAEVEYADEYIIPESSSRKLTKADLKGLSKKQLRLARNEIYARHGRLFLDEKLQAYFDKQEWYCGYIEPEDFVDSKELSKIERWNADFIKKFE